MAHVCGGVIGYPITPSTEISETFEAARAEGQLNVWGKHAFFVEAEGEHSAQSGALGAALTGGNYISNASSSQGILYALESHYVTAGKRIGGFVLQVAARVVSKHSLNVMAGHDDVYALLPAGYTILFGSDPEETADLAAIAYKTSALSLIPVANAMDGFATSHVMCEARLPEPALLKEYLGDPASRIACPTKAQEVLFGAKGRAWALDAWLDRHAGDFPPSDLEALRGYLAANGEAIEADADAALIAKALPWVPKELRQPFRRQWVNAWTKGTRQLVPALVDPNNPGLTGPVQNQPDFQAGSADHRTHFAAAVPSLVRAAMAEYNGMTGRSYAPVMTYDCEDADYIMVAMGSITEDIRAVVTYLRGQGQKVGVVSVKLLQPFPEAELVEAVKGAKAVMVLERSDDTALTRLVSQALFKASSNHQASQARYPGIPPIAAAPQLTTGIFGLGGHDVQPRHIVAAFEAMTNDDLAPLIYLGSQFFSENPTGLQAEIQEQMRQAYPETAAMALTTGENPPILPPEALRIRFHSVGGYGTIATGKLLTDVLSGVLGMRSKSAPKYGSEKSGAATNYYITLSPEPVFLTNNELEDVEVVVSPDHQVFIHTNPLKGLVRDGTFILQASQSPAEVWASLPEYARRTIKERNIHFYVVDAFKVARRLAPDPALQTRMMGIAFVGAIAGHVDAVLEQAGSLDKVMDKVRHEIDHKFGRKGKAIVDSNMAVIEAASEATERVNYDELVTAESATERRQQRTVALSAAMSLSATAVRPQALFDPDYFNTAVGTPFKEGTIAETPVLPGTGLFMPPATGAGKDKGIFRREVPLFTPEGCTGCLECAIACPDTAIPNTVHELHDLLTSAIAAIAPPPAQRTKLDGLVPAWGAEARRLLLETPDAGTWPEILRPAASALGDDQLIAKHIDALVEHLAAFPVARTRPFFDAMEKERAGSGGLLSVVVDPWKCTGCMQCVDVCGPGVLHTVDQDGSILDLIQARFEAMTALPNTPQRFTAGALEEGDFKRLLLDHTAYYSMTGGHGACRGCGEVTPIHLISTICHAQGKAQRGQHVAKLTELIDQLKAKLDGLEADQAGRAERIANLIETLDRCLFNYEAGPTGAGPAPVVYANSTGCSSVYASTMPFNPYPDPWVNSLFQDAQPLAAGIYEGLASQLVGEVRATRLAAAELDDAYTPDLAAALATLDWRDFTPAEAALMPALVSMSGDGAAYDIGFGALSRVLANGVPIKTVVLDTGGYSNTGGQASTASYTGQDADLARYGKAHAGKREARKELGLIALFHPSVYVAATCSALHSHFFAAAAGLLAYQGGAGVIQLFTPCGTENGFSEELSAERGRIAVESRMAPMFVHDPARGESLPERLSLDGNPAMDQIWASHNIQHVDAEGKTQLLEAPLTPADFALGEIRFAKQFSKLRPEVEEQAIPLAEFIELPPDQRLGKVAFIYSTDKRQRLIKVAVSEAMVELVEERKRFWLTLRLLAGRDQALANAEHLAHVKALEAQYSEALDAREQSLDQIAAAMADLATSSAAPTTGLAASIGVGSPAQAAPAGPGPGAEAPASDGTSPCDYPVWLDPADLPKCNDCATCYQELPALFEKTTILVDGAPQIVGRMIEGAIDSVVIDAEMARRIKRVKANCDAEIIQ